MSKIELRYSTLTKEAFTAMRIAGATFIDDNFVVVINFHANPLLIPSIYATCEHPFMLPLRRT
jgi:hypothetical protein